MQKSDHEEDEEELYDELMRIRLENVEKMRQIKESEAYRELHDILRLQQGGEAEEQYDGNFLIQDAIRNPNSRTEEVINELAATELLQNEEYQVLITQLDDSKYDIKDEDRIDRILRPDYLNSVEYPQIASREFSENVLKAQLPYDVQSVLTDFSQATQLSLRAPLLSSEASRVFSRFGAAGAGEALDMKIADGDYIKEQRNERLLRQRLDAIDSTLQFLDSEQEIEPLTKDQIRPFLVEFYADPANFGGACGGTDGLIEFSRSAEDERRLGELMREIRPRAEELSAQGAEAAGAVLDELLEEIQVEERGMDDVLEATAEGLRAEGEERARDQRAEQFAAQEAQILRQAEEISQRKPPPGPLKRVSSARRGAAANTTSGETSGAAAARGGECGVKCGDLGSKSGKKTENAAAAPPITSRPTSARIRDILGKIQ